jgi:hypothetical protein
MQGVLGIFYSLVMQAFVGMQNSVQPLAMSFAIAMAVAKRPYSGC